MAKEKTPGPDDRVVPVNPTQWDQLTREQQLEANRVLQELTTGPKPDFVITTTLQTMLWSRQLYYAALVRVQDRLAELKLPEGVVAAMAGAVAKSALDGSFLLEDLAKQAEGHVLPWLAAAMRADAAIEQATRVARVRDEHAERLARSVPCEFSWIGDDGNPRTTLDRGKAVILSCPYNTWNAATEDTMRKAVKTTHSGRKVFHAVRLSVVNFNVPGSMRKYERRDWPFERWQHQAETQGQWERLMRPIVESMNDGALDLLIIDNILELVPPNAATEQVSAVALGKAMNNVTRWANEQGVAVVGCFFTPNPDTTGERARIETLLQHMPVLRLLETEEGYTCEPLLKEMKTDE